MGNALLAGLFENWPKYDIGEGAFMAVFGFAFVFLGIVILILLFTALGKIMAVVNGKRKVKPVVAKTSSKPRKTQPKEETDDELIAVITAAIAAYYEGENTKCDFVVRRIKKL